MMRRWATLWRRDRMPRVQAGVGAWIPGWVLHVVAALLPGAIVQTLAATLPVNSAAITALAWAAAGCVAWSVWRPGHAPALAALCVSTLVLLLAPGPNPQRVALWLAPAGYLALRANLWAAATQWPARVELRALARSARRDTVIVAVTLLAGSLGLLVSGASGVLLAVAGVALVILVTLTLWSHAVGRDTVESAH